MNKEKSAKEIIRRLDLEYPDAKCHLDFSTPFELLVSTVLAAQCTDVRVNKIMVPLYKSKYKKPEDILKDGMDNFREEIKSINFFNNKAKAILVICSDLKIRFKNKIPGNMQDLVSLKGIGRKSASVLLGNCFGQNDVIIVDTHLSRVTARLGLIENENPEKIEKELQEIIPAQEQFTFSLGIGEHGRQVCKAKKPDCSNCFLNDICPSKINL
ncbi:MAG TPA: endonuclease III [Ignavibacteria bacterium]